MISGVVYFRENISGSSRNVSETTPWSLKVVAEVFIIHKSPHDLIIAMAGSAVFRLICQFKTRYFNPTSASSAHVY